MFSDVWAYNHHFDNSGALLQGDGGGSIIQTGHLYPISDGTYNLGIDGSNNYANVYTYASGLTSTNGYYDNYGAGTEYMDYSYGVSSGYANYWDLTAGTYAGGYTTMSCEMLDGIDSTGFVRNPLQSNVDANTYDITNGGLFSSTRFKIGTFSSDNAAFLNYNPYLVISSGVPSNDLTYSLWIYPTGTLAENYHELLVSTAWNDAQWIITTDGHIQWYNPYCPSGVITTSDIIVNTPNQWYMLTITKNNSGYVKMYNNNTELALDNHNCPGVQASGDNWIGKRNDGNHPFRGKMDELGIWNISLTSGEITTIYNSGNGLYLNSSNTPQYANFVNGYHFDETGIDTTAVDWKGGNNALAYGNVLYQAGKIISGIGTADTGEQLLVVGNGRFTGNVTVNTNVYASNLCYSNGTNCNITNTSYSLVGHGHPYIDFYGNTLTSEPEGEVALNWGEALLYSFIYDRIVMNWDRSTLYYDWTADSNFYVNNNLNVTKNTTLNNLNVTGNTTLTNLSLSGILNTSDSVYVTGNVRILGNFSAKRPYWNGYNNSTQNFLNTSNTQIINISNNNDYDAWLIAVEGNQNVTFQQTGDYLCVLSPEFYQATGTNKIITFWFQKSNTSGVFNDVAWSNSRYTITNGQYFAPSITYQFDIINTTHEKVRFMWYSDSTSTQIISISGLTSPTRPSIPGILLNCQKVSEITE